ncbi:MAG TPA: cyclic nucleotide-binding domain-containing protein [Bryobacteraceae bacterium]|nr:cyclic nucleotide-binding domain-containing protein [Bryobacteraceae bacterium]
MALLAHVPAFETMASSEIEQIAKAAKEERYHPGAVVMLEGHEADRFAIVESGEALVSIFDNRSQSVPIAQLHAGEFFGEAALLEPGRRRNATVTASKPLHLLTLDAALFRRMIGELPQAREAFERNAELIAVSNFLKMCTPFGALSPAQLRELAGKLTRVTVAAGSVVVRQGDIGRSCYLVRAGSLEVLLEADGSERKLATLGRGSIFGETALMIDAPRNATVRSKETCDLLELGRDDLAAALGEDQKFARRMFELLQMRGRPRQASGIEAHKRTTEDGNQIYYLKNPAKGTYYKLAERGWFLWQRLDGSNGMRDLVCAWFAEFGSFDPGAIAQTLGGLAMAGFLEGVDLQMKAAMSMIRLKWWQRALLTASRAVDWRWTLRGVDAFFTDAYRGWGHPLFSRPALFAFALISALGLGVFFFDAPTGKAVLAAHGRLKWLVIPAYLVCTALHEFAHALTTKHCGREVNGAGLGWYRFSPVAFIDTSDMWLAGRWERIAVTAAGPAMNLILAGAASLLIPFTSNPVLIAGLWQLAVISYVLVLINLNPLLELDGYYLLMDWLERPNLRKKALEWLAHGLGPALRTTGQLREHRFELLYGAGTLIYVVFTSIAVAISMRAYADRWISRWMPSVASHYAAYVFAVILMGFFLARIAMDLRGKTRSFMP